MTRNEERKQRAKEIFDIPHSQAIFMCGAEWADKTMIEKSCEWLSIMLDNQVVISNMDLFLTKFKKAMMEE